MCAMQQLERAVDWYDIVCQQIDVLREDARKYADKDEVVPPDWFFDKVKDEIQNLRQLANYPTIPVPDVWLAPEGQIGLTWDGDAGEKSFDLIFGLQKVTARLTVAFKQQIVETKDVPATLAQLAA